MVGNFSEHGSSKINTREQDPNGIYAYLAQIEGIIEDVPPSY